MLNIGRRGVYVIYKARRFTLAKGKTLENTKDEVTTDFKKEMFLAVKATFLSAERSSISADIWESNPRLL